MNRRADKDRLLDDVLGGDAGFRDASLRETLRVAKRRQNVRRTRNVASVVAVILIGFALLWRPATPRPERAPVVERRSDELISSQALSVVELVISKPLAPGQVITSSAHFATIETASATNAVREIDDGQLLSLLGTTPAALVRDGQRTAQIVFLNAEDEGRYLKN